MRMDRRTDMTKLTVVFRSFAKVPKQEKCFDVSLTVHHSIDLFQ